MEILNDLIEFSIINISFDVNDRKVDIYFKSPNNLTKFKIEATGVDDFLANDLRINNIIDQIFIYGDKDDIDVDEELLNLLAGGALNNDLYKEIVNDRAISIKNGDLLFWIISPIAGSSVYLLAKNIQLIKIP